MFHIKNLKINSDIIIAPMAGITNEAFRQLCFEFDAGLVYTEMVSDKAIFYKNNKTKEMIEISNELHPVSSQLFGADLDTMVYAAKVLDNETYCDIIDINMGCPVNKVIKTGAGSAMMLKEDETVEIVKNIVLNVKKPVTVKMRLGYDKSHINFLSLSKKLEDVGVSAIALHARTRSQMYEGKADWSYIKQLKESVNIPVFGNGDVKTLDDYIKMKEETGCDGVMIGRGIVGNPFLIKEISNYNNNKEIKHITNDDKFDYCLVHAKKLMSLKGENRAISEMRGLAPHYLTGMYNAAMYRGKLNQINTYNDLEAIILEYKEYLNKAGY